MQGDRSEMSQMDKMVDLLLAGKLPQARQVAEAMQDVDYREWMLNDLVKSMVSAGAVESATTVAQFMAVSFYKADALRSVAKYLAARGDAPAALSVLEESDKIPVEVQLPGALDADIAPDKAAALYEISKLLEAAGDREHAGTLRLEAIQVARAGETSSNTQYVMDSSKLLRIIARDLAASGDMAAARSVAQSIAHPYVQEQALEMLDEMGNEP